MVVEGAKQSRGGAAAFGGGRRGFDDFFEGGQREGSALVFGEGAEALDPGGDVGAVRPNHEVEEVLGVAFGGGGGGRHEFVGEGEVVFLEGEEAEQEGAVGRRHRGQGTGHKGRR